MAVLLHIVPYEGQDMILPSRPPRQNKRRGTTVVFFAACLVICFICMAFAIDTGILCLVRTQAQACADATALAAAWEMVSEERLEGNMEPIYAAAHDKAIEYASLQSVNGSPFSLSANNANDPEGEVVIGRLNNLADRSESLSFGGTDPYNAVQVRVRCSSELDNPVVLFFAGILGINTAGVAAEATAVFDDSDTVGFRITEKTGPCSLAPFAVSIDDWNDLLAGNGPDELAVDPDTQTVSSGSDGKRELKMFPEKQKNKGKGSGIVPGNFGTVDLGSAGNSTAELRRQIREGPSAADLEHYGGELKLDPDSGTLSVGGDPGVSAGMKDALNDIIGQPRTVLLYSDVSGQGNNASFTIVGFAGVRIVESTLTGGDKHITIQPAVVSDKTAISGDNTGTSSFVGPPVHLVR